MQDCAILNQCLEEVAKQYPATKFLKVISTGEQRRLGMPSPANRRPPPQPCHATWLPVPQPIPALLPAPLLFVSAECIPGYPDENLPTVLLYKDTKCVQSLVGLRQFGGRGTSPELLAISLNRHGEVCGDTEQQEQQVRTLVSRLLLREAEARQTGGEGGGGDDDE